jgi:hypothetical protein
VDDPVVVESVVPDECFLFFFFFVRLRVPFPVPLWSAEVPDWSIVEEPLCDPERVPLWPLPEPVVPEPV